MIARFFAPLLALGTANACACSCNVPPLEQMLDEAEYVAVVRIRTVALDPEWQQSLSGVERREALTLDVEVVEEIRGKFGPDVALSGHFDDSGCGLAAEPGTDLLIASTLIDDRLPLHRCSASMVLGRHSLYPKTDPRTRLDGPAAAYLAAVRLYVQANEPIHPCAVNEFPPLSPENSIARDEQCQAHFEQAAETEAR